MSVLIIVVVIAIIVGTVVGYKKLKNYSFEVAQKTQQMPINALSYLIAIGLIAGIAFAQTSAALSVIIIFATIILQVVTNLRFKNPKDIALMTLFQVMNSLLAVWRIIRPAVDIFTSMAMGGGAHAGSGTKAPSYKDELNRYQQENQQYEQNQADMHARSMGYANEADAKRSGVSERDLWKEERTAQSGYDSYSE